MEKDIWKNIIVKKTPHGIVIHIFSESYGVCSGNELIHEVMIMD